MFHFFLPWSLSLSFTKLLVKDVSSSSSDSIYRSLYFTPPTNVPLISFNIVGKVLIVSSAPWSLSMSFELKNMGVASRVLESA
jgi:hypothetical protein